MRSLIIGESPLLDALRTRLKSIPASVYTVPGVYKSRSRRGSWWSILCHPDSVAWCSRTVLRIGFRSPKQVGKYCGAVKTIHRTVPQGSWNGMRLGRLVT